MIEMNAKISNLIQQLIAKWRRISYLRNVPTHRFKHSEFDGYDLDLWIQRGILGYQQWYQSVDFGNGIIADVTTPPDWQPRPELNPGSGLDRWNFIIRRNLPDVQGMRVLDLGCNVGLYSIELARMGAREVVAVDRDTTIRQRTGQLPRVDIVSQAEFVREAFELREGKKYPVTFQAINFKNLTALKSLGWFDLILALNVVYHELDRAPSLVNTLGEMTNEIVLQGSVVHPPPIRDWALPKTSVEMLTVAGFDFVTVDYPFGYSQPVVRGVRKQKNDHK